MESVSCMEFSNLYSMLIVCNGSSLDFLNPSLDWKFVNSLRFNNSFGNIGHLELNNDVVFAFSDIFQTFVINLETFEYQSYDLSIYLPDSSTLFDSLITLDSTQE